MEFDGFDEDDEYFSPPPHPDDRLWRHPSEIARGQAYVPGEDGLDGSIARELDASTHTSGDSDLLARVAARWPLSLAVAGAAVVVAMLGSSQFLANSSTSDIPALSAQARAPEVALVSSARGEDEWRETLRDLIEPSLPRVDVVAGSISRTGRGIVLSESGHIMTSAQLTNAADMIIVRTSEGKRFTAHITGTDPLTDVAVITIDEHQEFTDPVAPIAVDAMLQAGYHALTLPATDHNTLLTGQINYVGAKRMLGNGQGSYGMIDVEVPSGDVAAGTAVFDEQGRTIGMVPLLADAGPSTAVVPIKMAHRIASELVLGTFERPWLGIKVREAQEAGSVTGSVVEVVEIFESGPASDADIAVGDRITSFGGVEMTSTSDLLMGVWGHRADDEVHIGILRDLEHFYEPLTLTPRPATSGESDS